MDIKVSLIGAPEYQHFSDAWITATASRLNVTKGEIVDMLLRYKNEAEKYSFSDACNEDTTFPKVDDYVKVVREDMRTKDFETYNEKKARMDADEKRKKDAVKALLDQM